MDFDTPDDYADTLLIAFERLRQSGWVQSYTLDGLKPTHVVWTHEGHARLAMLREFSRQLKLTEGKGVARTVCWLAEQFGADIRR